MTTTIGAALVALAALVSAGPAAAAIPAGEYAVAATVRVRAGELIDRELREQARASIAPAAGGRVRVRLSTRGHACELAARAGASGALAFDPGQRCAVELDDEDVRGRVDAALTSGTGRAQGDTLELALQWSLSGAVRMKVGGQRVEVMGTTLDVPDAWAPEVPVRGTADARGQGKRARSSDAPPGARR